ncbi:hypothetical protein GY45DRAFT_1366599 [Cubamyces sp. BRFM 1775]|nr:hypothetical protein GY45DRAFT_1366599 [Cubamyces sp. BRFM 1775]
MAVASRIPPEILEIIFIEFQRDPNGVSDNQWLFYIEKDTQALASCSLVCRWWSPVARAQLFRYVILTLDRHSSDKFLAFIQSTPHVASLIRCLLLISNTGSHAGRGECPALLVGIVGALPALSRVGFYDFRLLGWPRGVPMPLRSTYLAHLTLRRLSYEPASDPYRVPFDILSLFDVGRLVSFNNRLYNPGRDEHIPDMFVRPGSKLPTVRELVLDDCDCFVKCNLERGGLDVERIRLLSLTWSAFGEPRYAQSLISRYGTYATDVHLNLCMMAGDERSYGASFWEPFSLARCARVERLRLSWTHSFLVRTSDEGYSEAYEAVLASTPPTLRELEFSFSPALGDSEQLRRTAPHVAQRIVQAVSRFPDLNRVTLSIMRPLRVDDCTAVMNDLLPRAIVDRGLVVSKRAAD